MDETGKMKSRFRSYWDTPRGKFFTLFFVLLIVIPLFVQYKLNAVIGLGVVAIISYYTTNDSKFMSRFATNQLLVALGLIEAVSVSISGSADIGIISIGLGLLLGAEIVGFVHTILILCIVIGVINLIRYRKDSTTTSHEPD